MAPDAMPSGRNVIQHIDRSIPHHRGTPPAPHDPPRTAAAPGVGCGVAQPDVLLEALEKYSI